MTDDQMERIIGNLLRAGVALSAAVVSAGGAWFLADTSPSGRVDYHRFHAGPAGLHSLALLPAPQTLILIGLLILIATPVARVVFSLVAFALERDWVYVAITSVVLIVLLYSLGSTLW